MNKYHFSHAERYAVWLHHEKRCWLCLEPLRLIETTIDHVVPESLLEDQSTLQKIVDMYALPSDFAINGFGNWLPCHHHCNERKSSTAFELVPINQVILERLKRDAAKVAATAGSIKLNVTKDKLFAKIFVGLQENRISIDDLESLVGDLGGGVFHRDDAPRDTEQFIRLDNGYWLRKEDVVASGVCTCERVACVDHNVRVMCVWGKPLSTWVIQKRLYWKCYDEIVKCPRCGRSHKRGHIGRDGDCLLPFTDQINQTD